MSNKEAKIGWSLIPPHIIVREDLSANEKLLFGRIMGLLSAKGYCFASNYWLGKQIGLKANSVAKIIIHLKKMGLVYTEVVRDDRKKIVERRIFVGRMDNHPIPLGQPSNTPLGQPSNTPPQENHHKHEQKTLKKGPRVDSKRVEYSYKVTNASLKDSSEQTSSENPVEEKINRKKSKKSNKSSWGSYSRQEEKKYDLKELTPLEKWELAWEIKVPLMFVYEKHKALLSWAKINGVKNRGTTRDHLEIWIRRSIASGEIRTIEDSWMDIVVLKDMHPDAIKQKEAWHKSKVEEGVL